MLASVVQTSCVFKVVDWEYVQSSAVPPGHALPLTDLLEFGVDLQARAVPGVGLQTQRTTDSTAILNLRNRRGVVPRGTNPAHKVSTPGLRVSRMVNFDPIWPVGAMRATTRSGQMAQN